MAGVNQAIQMNHALESATNVIVGYILNVGLVYWLLHWMGYQIQMGQNAGMSLVLAGVAFVRGVCIRKVFSRHDSD